MDAVSNRRFAPIALLALVTTLLMGACGSDGRKASTGGQAAPPAAGSEATGRLLAGPRCGPGQRTVVAPPAAGILHGAMPSLLHDDSLSGPRSGERVRSFERLADRRLAWVYFSDNWFQGSGSRPKRSSPCARLARCRSSGSCRDRNGRTGRSTRSIARRRVAGSDLVHFHLERFEDVSLPLGKFDAVFSGSAFHWVDPSVGWAKAAALLRPGGAVALVQPIGVRDEGDGSAVEELEEVFARLAPEVARDRPALRDLTTIRAGVEARRENVSEVWAWLAHPSLAVPEAEKLFGQRRSRPSPGSGADG